MKTKIIDLPEPTRQTMKTLGKDGNEVSQYRFDYGALAFGFLAGLSVSIAGFIWPLIYKLFTN